MSTLQIKFETVEQWRTVLALLRKLKIEFHIVESTEFVDEEADSDLHDAYRASIPVLADDWDDPANDHWVK